MAEEREQAVAFRPRRFRRYPDYKDSSVAWLGEIPAHWKVRRLKDQGALVGGAGFPHDYQGISDEVLPFYKVGDLSASSDRRHMRLAPNTVSPEIARELRARVIPANSIVYAKIGAALLLNRRRVTTLPCCIDNNMSAYVPCNELTTEWAFHWTAAVDFAAFAHPGAVPSLSEGDQADIPIVIPSLPEQHAIADFLDLETARIDALVAKKERLRELLQEKRTALIARAVTRGLDPNVPIKDSGIEWLGSIPKHWEAGALSRWWTVLDCKHRTVPFCDQGMAVASIGEVHGLKVDLSNANRTSFEEYQRMIGGERKPQSGDVIYSRNATVGEAAIVDNDEPFCMGQDVSLIRSVGAKPLFLLHALRSRVVLGQVERLMVGSTFKRINVGQIKKLVVPVPPKSEQEDIAQYAQDVHDTIGSLIQRVRTAMDLLKEFRTALISAAVTGKIDLRKEAA